MNAETKRIAIILDDGPHPEHCAAFLELFAARKISVSFAYIGANVEKYPEFAKKSADSGHEIINHSYSHAHPNELSDEALKTEIVHGQQVISKGSGTAPLWYWPPYLESDDRMKALFKDANIEIYPLRELVSSEDWNRDIASKEIFQRATTGISDGRVILFHEWRKETLELMPKIIEELQRQGCEFLTFTELARINSVSQ